MFRRHHRVASRGRCPSLPGLATLGAYMTALLLAGCSSPSQDHWAQGYDAQRYGRSREAITDHFNLHRGRWWNYYARGRWYLESRHTALAAEDFRAAIRLRGDDKRDARSYGMHFWDYYPNRELGIALSRQGKHAEAIQSLTASLVTASSSRAKYYLNKARAAELKQSGVDKAVPVIRIDSPRDGLISRSRRVRLRGTVTDDQFVSGVAIGERDLFVELADRKIEFDEQVRLAPGANTVTVKAVDLSGRRGVGQVSVTVDVQPPIVYVHRLTKAGQPAGSVLLQMAVTDNHGLKTIQVEEKTVVCGGSKLKRIDRLAVVPGPDGLSITATDLAGNTTRALIDTSASEFRGRAREAAPLRRARRQPLERAYPMWGGSVIAFGPWPMAQADDGMRLAGDDTQTDRVAPRIRLNVPKDVPKYIVSDSTFFLDGTLYDPAGVSSLRINNENIPLAAGRNAHVAFSHLIDLADGENRITLVTADRFGNESRRVIRVERQEVEAFLPEARYRVAVVPLSETGPDKGSIVSLYNALLSALLAEPVRFNIVERNREALEKILTEHNLTRLADKRTAIRLGKILTAEGMLFGEIEEGRDYVNVSLRFTDVESSELLYITDVYTEGKGAQAIRWCARGLVSKLKRDFPLVQGEIARLEGASIGLDVGKDNALRRGMKLLLYRETETGRQHKRTLIKHGGKSVEARLMEVGAHRSSAQLMDKRAATIVRVEDKFITK